MVAAAAAFLGYVQIGSDAVFSSAGVPGSLPAHLSPSFGTAIYRRLERVAPAPYVRMMLARAALNRGDLREAYAQAAPLPPSPVRAELLAEIAQTRGDDAEAQREFLRAADVAAVTAEVERLAVNRPAAAYSLELRLEKRLAALQTHPDAVADAYWRLGQIATQEGDLQLGLMQYRRAIALAPLDEKYLLAAGAQGLNMRDAKIARRWYRRTLSVDPASAIAYAGLGLAALMDGDRASARRYAARSRAIDPNAPILHTLEAKLR